MGGNTPTQPWRNVKPKVSLIVPVINGLAPHKTVPRLFKEAKEHGLATVMGLDRDTTDGTLEATRHLVDHLVPFDCDVCYIEGNMNEIADAAETEWGFWVCDDELPSEQLWQFAANIYKHGPYIHRPHMLAPLPDWTASYKPLNTYQPRLFRMDSIRWTGGGMDRLVNESLPERNIPEVLWHFNIWASRESREEKVRLHEAAWQEAWQYHPWPPSSNKAYLWEDYPADVESLESYREYLPDPLK